MMIGLRLFVLASILPVSPFPPNLEGAVPLFDNLGTHHHPVTTTSPLAQRYFDQGLRLYYAFNSDEALRSFQQAARLDPNCAMAYWGIALALGPNINMPMTRQGEDTAYRAIQIAESLSNAASERERAYIAALGRRYSHQGAGDPAVRGRSYAAAMRDLANRFPRDPDAATLFGGALLNLRPWDQWTPDGRPQPGTLEAVATLEGVLQLNPNHPGANHYYIHALEASPYPEKALPAAERIDELMPGAGHLVHMPSHIYFRLGRYAEAVESSRRGAAVDREYIRKWNPQGNYREMFYPHNIYFEWAALMMEGRSTEVLRAAGELSEFYSYETARSRPFVEFFMPVVLFSLARFGKWDDILRQPRPPNELRYLTGMWHYARGLALAARGQSNKASFEKERLADIAAAVASRVPLVGNSPAVLLRLASTVLTGELAARRGGTEEAIHHLQEAVQLHDQLRYDEPPAWYYPVRQALGAVLLAAGRAQEAEQIYRDDLEKHPRNGWSLFGLAECLRVQQKDEEAAAVEVEFRRAWARADVTLEASRF